jgi:hypothetical protein
MSLKNTAKRKKLDTQDGITYDPICRTYIGQVNKETESGLAAMGRMVRETERGCQWSQDFFSEA